MKNLSAIEDFYWAFVDSSQAALMMHGRAPPSPEHISQLLLDIFVRNKKLQKSHVEWFDELYHLAHAIQNNQVQHISGETYDKWLKRTVEFTKVMENITKSGEHEYFKK